MNKKRLIIALIIFVALLLLAGCIVGTWFVVTTLKKNSPSEDISSETNGEETSIQIAYDKARAEGTATFIDNGDEYEIEVVAKMNEQQDTYLSLTLDEEVLYIYTEQQDPDMYIYIGNESDSVRFLMVDDSEEMDMYEEFSTASPLEIMEGMEELEEDENITITNEGQEACREMQCEKYKIVDSTPGQEGEMYLWMDTDEGWPRIVSVESDTMVGTFDIYYDNADFTYPGDYEEIEIETILGLQRLYWIAGDFVNVFI